MPPIDGNSGGELLEGGLDFQGGDDPLPELLLRDGSGRVSVPRPEQVDDAAEVRLELGDQRLDECPFLRRRDGRRVRPRRLRLRLRHEDEDLLLGVAALGGVGALLLVRLVAVRLPPPRRHQLALDSSAPVVWEEGSVSKAATGGVLHARPMASHFCSDCTKRAWSEACPSRTAFSAA